MESKILLLSGIFIVISVSIWIAKKKEKEEQELKQNAVPASDTVEDAPVSFGYKCVWFAIKSTDRDEVAKILGLKNPVESNWQKGIKEAFGGAVFITPPIDGWILAVGWGLPAGDSVEGMEKVTNLANILSLHFGEAQFFCTHRVVAYHCWMKSVNRKLERLYSYLGEKGENIAISGQLTDAEKDYNLINTFSEEAQSEDYFEREDLVYPDEEMVMEIAGAWSINPQLIEDNNNIKGLGLLGTLK